MNRLLPRALLAPAVVTLFLWMIVPLVMTIYFSLVRYNLMQPGDKDRQTGLQSGPHRLGGGGHQHVGRHVRKARPVQWVGRRTRRPNERERHERK